MAVRIDPNVNSAVAQNPTGAAGADRPSALDFKQFAALRRADPNDPRALREVARQFESIFTKMMLEGMRNASFGDPLFGSDQADMYQGLMDDQMAVQLSSGRGIGLADMLFRQLQGGRGASAAADPLDPDAGAAFDGATSAMRGAGSAQVEGPVVDDAQKRRFIEQMLPHARAAAFQLGVDERSVIAQAALETGWGTAQPGETSGGSNNFFGIKTGSRWQGPSVVSETTEFADGVAATERASFRSYRNVAENMNDYVQLLSSRYAAALNTGSDVRAFAGALQRGGYATDPRYAEKLVAVAAKLERLM